MIQYNVTIGLCITENIDYCMSLLQSSIVATDLLVNFKNVIGFF